VGERADQPRADRRGPALPRGSPEQITGDVVGLNGLGGVDWVVFDNTAAGYVHELVRLLGELKAAVEAAS
jgi:hypothetical protein